MAGAKSIFSLSNPPPLRYENEYTSDFVDVSGYKQIRIAIESDTMLWMFYEWSIDGEDAHILDKWECHANSWKTDIVNVVMPYLRIRFEKKIPGSNNRLQLFVTPLSMNKAITSTHIENDKEPGSKKRSKSPFFRRPSEKKAAPASSSLDYRLPTFIPSGALLVGGKNGQIEFLPRGAEGEVLVMGERGLEWCDLSQIQRF